MKKTPKVSVLMPVYQTPEQYLREAIESILSQSFSDFEFLILDDCPEHYVEDIVKSYKDKRIKYFKNKRNLGISDSRNKLINMAKGTYLAIMDHDDIALPERFAKEVELLDTNPEIGVVGTWYKTFPKEQVVKKYVMNEQIERDLMYHCTILHPSSMLRKSVLEENNLHYEAEFSPSEDYALWCRLIGKTKFANIPEVLQKYRDHGSNTSKTQADKMSLATKKIHDMLKQIQPELYRRTNRKIKYRLLGFPLFKMTRRGLRFKYKFFGIFKYKGWEEIHLTDGKKIS